MSNSFDQELKRIEGLPEGPERDKAFNALVASFTESSKTVPKKERRKTRAKIDNLQAYNEAIKKEHLDQPLNKVTQDALARLTEQQRELQHLGQVLTQSGPAGQEGGLTVTDKEALQIALKRAERIAELKQMHGIELSPSESQLLMPAPPQYGQEAGPLIIDEAPDEGYNTAADPRFFSTTADPKAGETLGVAADAGRITKTQSKKQKEALSDYQERRRTPDGMSIGGAPADPSTMAAAAVNILDSATKPIQRVGGMIGGAAAELALEVTGSPYSSYERSKDETIQRQEAAVKDKSILQAAGSDAHSMVEAPWELFQSVIFGAPGEKEKGIADTYGKLGGQAVSSMMGEYGALLDDPIRAFKANPVMTTIAVMPVLQLARNGAAAAGLTAEQVKKLTRFNQLEDVLQPYISKIKRVAGRRPEVKALIDEMLTTPGQLEDQIISIGTRLAALVDNPEKFNKVLGQLKEALPKAEEIAAHIGKIKDRWFGEDAPNGTPKSILEEMKSKKEAIDPAAAIDELDGMSYDTGIPEIPLEPDRWGLSELADDFVKDMLDPEMRFDLIERSQQVARAERSAVVKERWQQSKPLLAEKAKQLPQWQTRALSQEAKAYLGEFEDVVVPAAFDRAIKFRMRSENKQMWSGIHRLHQLMKKNLTVYNVSSGLGNFISNVMMQVLYRGQDPLTILHKGFELQSQFKKWVMGEDVAPELQSFFLQAEKRGLMTSTSLIDAELGAAADMLGGIEGAAVGGAAGAALGLTMGGLEGATMGAAAGGVGVPLLEKIVSRTPLKRALELQRDFYQFGDNIFKLEQGWHEYNLHLKDIEALGPLEYKVVPHTGKESVQVGRDDGGRWTLDGEVEYNPRRVREVLMDSGIQSAQDRFFDYRNVGWFTDWARTTPLMSLFSPFITWQFKAMDLPGKKGLISRTLEQPGRGFTNSPRLAAKQFLRNTELSLRRGLWINSMRANMSEHRDEFRRWLAYSPNEPRAILMRYTTNPLWIEADDIEQYNWMAPGMAIMRFADGLLNNAPSEKEILEYVDYVTELDDLRHSKIIPKEMVELTREHLKQLIRTSRNDATMGDVLKLMGISGSVWSDVFTMVNEASEKGQYLDPEKLYNATSTALIGGGFSKVIKMFMGATDGDAYLMSGYTERAGQSPDVRESFIRFSVRGLLGIGFRPMYIGDKNSSEYKDRKPTQYLSRGMLRKKRVLLANMFKGMEKKVLDLRRKAADLDGILKAQVKAGGSRELLKSEANPYRQKADYYEKAIASWREIVDDEFSKIMSHMSSQLQDLRDLPKIREGLTLDQLKDQGINLKDISNRNRRRMINALEKERRKEAK